MVRACRVLSIGNDEKKCCFQMCQIKQCGIEELVRQMGVTITVHRASGVMHRGAERGCNCQRKGEAMAAPEGEGCDSHDLRKF